MPPFYGQLAKNFNQWNILKSIKRIVFQQSHLAPYLPFIKEPLQSKISRVYDDQSYKDNISMQQSHEKMHQQASNNNKLQRILLTSQPCFDPLSNWLLAWYFLVFMAIVYTYVEVGMVLTYGSVAWTDINQNIGSLIVKVLVIILLVGDMLVQLNTGYLFRGVIITDKARVISRYVRTYFVADFLLVLLMIASTITANLFVSLAKIIVATKFLRMFEMDSLYIRRLSTSTNVKIVYVISKQMVTIFILAHTIGLFFYLIDYALVNDPICQNNNSLCWLYSATAYSPIIEYSWQIQYFYTLYWGVNTIATISYGDIAPNNPQETAYAIFCFCFGFIVYGYVVNNIIREILWARRVEDNFKHELIIYTTFMDNLKISREVQYEMRDYLQLNYLKENERVKPIEEEMKARLPEDLKDELLKNAYYKLHNHLEYILFKSPSITKLIYHVDQRKYSEKEVLLKQGDLLTHLFYLHDGEVSLTCSYGKKVVQITKINTSDSFLSHYQFFVNERASYTMSAVRTSTLYLLHRQRLQEMLQKYTDLRQNFKLIEYELRCAQNYMKIFYKCYFCQSNHHWYECVQTFPHFANTKFILPQAPKRRHSRPPHKTWKNRSAMQQLLKINNNAEFMVLQKVKQRIYELKKLKEEMKSSFDVDVCHEWNYYLPNYNFSVFRTNWNNSKKAKSHKEGSAKANSIMEKLMMV